MKKYIILLLIFLFNISVANGYNICDREVQKLESIKNEIDELGKEKDMLMSKLKRKFPNSSKSFIYKMYNKESEAIRERFYDLKYKYDKYTKEALKCIDETKKELDKKNREEKELFNKGLKFLENENYYDAIKTYEKLKRMEKNNWGKVNDSVKNNLAIAYYGYAQGELYKKNFANAKKYFFLAKNEGFSDLFAIYLSLGDATFLNSNNKVLELNEAKMYYEKALKYTSDYDKIKMLNNKIYTIDNILKEISNQICKEKYGEHSLKVGNKCACDLGYEWNTNKTYCIKKEPKEIIKKETKTVEKKADKNIEKIQKKADLILEKIDKKFSGFSSAKKKKTYEKFIKILTKYSDTKAKGDTKILIDLIIKGLQERLDNNSGNNTPEIWQAAYYKGGLNNSNIINGPVFTSYIGCKNWALSKKSEAYNNYVFCMKNCHNSVGDVPICEEVVRSWKPLPDSKTFDDYK